MPPGVTGLAQLNLPPDSDLTSVRRKLVLDREYIQRAGLLLDLRLLVCTFFRMLKVRDRWVLALFGLRRNVTVSAVSEQPSGNGTEGTGHAGPTPTSILIQSTCAPTKSDGKPSGGHSHSGRHRRGGNGRPKPK